MEQTIDTTFAERAQRYAAAIKDTDPILYGIYKRIAEDEWARVRRQESQARELVAA